MLFPPFFPRGLAGASSLFLVQKVAAAYGGEEVQYSDTFLLQHIVTGLYLCWEGHGAQLSATSDYSDRCPPASASTSACVWVWVSVCVGVGVSGGTALCKLRLQRQVYILLYIYTHTHTHIHTYMDR